MAKIPKKSLNIREVAKEIIDMKIEEKDSLKTLRNRFYKILIKHGIKEGTKQDVGVTVSNPEWTMCQGLFVDGIIGKLKWDNVIEEKPKSLRHY